MAEDNYFKILEEIKECAAHHGRNFSDLTLIAIIKDVDWDLAQVLYGYGQRDFGESRVQHLIQKHLLASKDVRWHLIGTLQKNKITKVVGKTSLIHSVHSLSLAESLSDASVRVGIKTSILLQVNISREATKQGLDPDEWKANIEYVQSLPGVKIEGLMTIGPHVNDERLIRTCFAKLRNLRDDLLKRANDQSLFKHLSMGMSKDFQWAIAEGATLLRIGSALFKN